MMKSDRQTELLSFYLVCLQCNGNHGLRSILKQFSVNHCLELSPPQRAYEERRRGYKDMVQNWTLRAARYVEFISTSHTSHRKNNSCMTLLIASPPYPVLIFLEQCNGSVSSQAIRFMSPSSLIFPTDFQTKKQSSTNYGI